MPAVTEHQRTRPLRRTSALTPGAIWLLDGDGNQKRISEFSGPEKRTVLCMFERRAKWSCSKGAACDLCHVIPEGKTKGGKGNGKRGETEKSAAKTAAVAAAAATAVTGSQGESLSTQVSDPPSCRAEVCVNLGMWGPVLVFFFVVLIFALFVVSANHSFVVSWTFCGLCVGR